MPPKNSFEFKLYVKTAAQEFWNALVNATDIFPKALSFTYRAIYVERGDGHSSSSIRTIHYGEDSPVIKMVEERILAAREDEKKLSCIIRGGDHFKYFNRFTYDIVVTEDSDATLVKWSSEFELKDQFIDPVFNFDILVKTIIQLDNYLQDKLAT